MENQEYTDPIMQKYVDTIKASTNRFKRVYYGDPIRVGASELPALIIAKVDTQASNMSNAEDMHSVRLLFTVITDIRDTISDDKTMVRGINSLYNIMEGRDSTYQLKPDSLLYILRHNVELDVGNNLRTDLNTISQVNYGMTIGKRGATEITMSMEGTIDVTANFTQVR